MHCCALCGICAPAHTHCDMFPQEELAEVTSRQQQLSSSESAARQQLAESMQAYDQASAACSSAEAELHRLSSALQDSETQLVLAQQKEAQVNTSSLLGGACLRIVQMLMLKCLFTCTRKAALRVHRLLPRCAYVLLKTAQLPRTQYLHCAQHAIGRACRYITDDCLHHALSPGTHSKDPAACISFAVYIGRLCAI